MIAIKSSVPKAAKTRDSARIPAQSYLPAWFRNALDNFENRLKALGIRVAEEHRKVDEEISSVIETPHTGYLGSQDTILGTT